MTPGAWLPAITLVVLRVKTYRIRPDIRLSRDKTVCFIARYYALLLPTRYNTVKRDRRVPNQLSKHWCNSSIQGVSRLYVITAGGDFLGFCDQKSSYKHVSDFGRLRSYGRLLIPVQALV